jgi:transposase, IS30 family
MKVALDQKLSNFVREKLEKKWSPERIAGYLKNTGKIVSGKAIYKYVRSRCLERYLFWKRLKRKKKSIQYVNGAKDAREYIEKRPILESSGHFEADFIVSSKSNYSLLVIVDRYSRNTWIKKIPNRKHATVVRAFENILPDYQIKTLTLDNDLAFNCWQRIESTLKCRVYFCHPYHSWEKGLVENTNRWIRCVIPKKKDIREVTKEELHSIRYSLNEIPRQCLGYRTAKEVLLNSRVS